MTLDCQVLVAWREPNVKNGEKQERWCVSSLRLGNEDCLCAKLFPPGWAGPSHRLAHPFLGGPHSSWMAPGIGLAHTQGLPLPVFGQEVLKLVVCNIFLSPARERWAGLRPPGRPEGSQPAPTFMTSHADHAPASAACSVSPVLTVSCGLWIIASILSPGLRQSIVPIGGGGKLSSERLRS